MSIDRDEAIKQIKAALKRRSRKTWSVTAGRGTSWGWLTIDAPPARRTWDDVQTTTPEPPSPGARYRGASAITPHEYIQRAMMGESDQDRVITCYADDPWAREAVEKGREVRFNWEVEAPGKPFGHMSPEDRVELALLLGLDRPAHHQGESVPAGSDFYREYVDRAEGRTPAVYGSRDWD